MIASASMARVDADPQVVEGILNRLGLRTRHQARTAENEVPHSDTLRGLGKNASCQHKRVHFRHATGLQCPRGCLERRPGRTHVIDEKHPPLPRTNARA